MVESSSGYAIVFIFTQDLGSPGLAANLSLTGSSSFVLDGPGPLQVLPYGTTATPALSNFNLSATSFAFSGVADASASRQSLELVTMVTAIGNTLDVTVGNVNASVLINCQFFGYPGNHPLKLGANSIPFPLT